MNTPWRIHSTGRKLFLLIIQPVKFMLTILSAMALFALTGCVSHRDRHDPTPDPARSAGVDGEYPGGLNHPETMQK